MSSAPRDATNGGPIVAVRALTGAGSRGLTRLPSGRVRVMGRKQPPLPGIEGSVTARTA